MDKIATFLTKNITLLDIYSNPLTFTHKGRFGYKTMAGGIGTLITMALTLFYAVTLFLQRNNRAIMNKYEQREDITKNNWDINLPEEGIDFAVFWTLNIDNNGTTTLLDLIEDGTGYVYLDKVITPNKEVGTNDTGLEDFEQYKLIKCDNSNFKRNNELENLHNPVREQKYCLKEKFIMNVCWYLE